MTDKVTGENDNNGFSSNPLDSGVSQHNTTNSHNNNNNHHQQQQQPLASISASVGWNFPQVKLASWDPENRKQWRKGGGKRIANRNLIISTINLYAAFGVWLVWSIIVSKIQLMHDQDPNIYPFHDWGTPTGIKYRNLLYTLPSVAGLSGGTLRTANAFMTFIVGGRNIVGHSSIMLTIAMIVTTYALSSSTTSFNFLLIAAWLSGTGGGAFASSMCNITGFFPKSKQGTALGINGGFGNFGVCITQLMLPIFMGLAFTSKPLSTITTTNIIEQDENGNIIEEEIIQVPIDGWPNRAGWFWWPFTTLCAIAAFIWMSNLPGHGCEIGDNNNSNTNNKEYNTTLWNIIYYYWFELVSLGSSSIAIIMLVFTIDLDIFTLTNSGKILHSILVVMIAFLCQHLSLVYLSPPSSYPKLKQQWKIFEDKHTYIMTFLYVMSFGSFIGFSGAFPKLITDLFGYVTTDGCYYNTNNTMMIDIYSINELQQQQQTQQQQTQEDRLLSSLFIQGGTEFDCIGNGGIWGISTITNPNRPNVFKFAWLGPAIGSLIRPIGGILADKHGGAKVTQILIIWCFIATICLGILITKTSKELKTNPELNFGLFVFLFLNVFFCTGALNGTTFRTIGVLFDNHQLAGPVLGWSSAIASYGAFVIPAMFGVSMSSGTPQVTIYSLAAYYFFCGILNYYYYCRIGCERPGV